MLPGPRRHFGAWGLGLKSGAGHRSGLREDHLKVSESADVYARLAAARKLLTAPGAPFEIVREEVLGRSNLVFARAPANLRTFWQDTRRFGTRPYLIYGNERIDYAAAHAQVDAIAAWMAAQDVAHGDRVAIAMRNYPEWLLVYWACAVLGAVSVGFNAWCTAPEMAYALADSVPKVLVVDGERLPVALRNCTDGAGPQLVCLRQESLPAGVTGWQEVVEYSGTVPDTAIAPDDVACILYTSGTTGHPKGAQLTHRGCISTVMNQRFSAAVTAMASSNPAAPPPGGPVVLITTPLFHVTANNCGAQPVTGDGGKVVLMHKWDATEALRLIAREGVTRMTGVPMMSRELIEHPEFATTDTSSLLAISAGGAQTPPDLVGRIAERARGARPATGYGMTETCGVITSVTGEFFAGKPDSAGPYLPNFEVKCVDDDGREVPQGQLGELWVRGSSVIKGYINKPEATAEAIVDGWLRTGDVARIDADGFLYLVDRKKDMVLRGGENVYCAEVEAALHAHPAIAEACVFGVPDDRLGEEVGAAIVLRPGVALGAERLRADCAGLIARHKVPRHIWFLPGPLPLNANGKVVKRALRESLRLEDCAA